MQLELRIKDKSFEGFYDAYTQHGLCTLSESAAGHREMQKSLEKSEKAWDTCFDLCIDNLPKSLLFSLTLRPAATLLLLTIKTIARILLFTHRLFFPLAEPERLQFWSELLSNPFAGDSEENLRKLHIQVFTPDFQEPKLLTSQEHHELCHSANEPIIKEEIRGSFVRASHRNEPVMREPSNYAIYRVTMDYIIIQVIRQIHTLPFYQINFDRLRAELQIAEALAYCGRGKSTTPQENALFRFFETHTNEELHAILSQITMPDQLSMGHGMLLSLITDLNNALNEQHHPEKILKVNDVYGNLTRWKHHLKSAYHALQTSGHKDLYPTELKLIKALLQAPNESEFLMILSQISEEDFNQIYSNYLHLAPNPYNLI